MTELLDKKRLTDSRQKKRKKERKKEKKEALHCESKSVNSGLNLPAYAAEFTLRPIKQNNSWKVSTN